MKISVKNIQVGKTYFLNTIYDDYIVFVREINNNEIEGDFYFVRSDVKPIMGGLFSITDSNTISSFEIDIFDFGTIQ